MVAGCPERSSGLARAWPERQGKGVCDRAVRKCAPRLGEPEYGRPGGSGLRARRCERDEGVLETGKAAPLDAAAVAILDGDDARAADMLDELGVVSEAARARLRAARAL